jgi:hypothetical protein
MINQTGKWNDDDEKDEVALGTAKAKLPRRSDGKRASSGRKQPAQQDDGSELASTTFSNSARSGGYFPTRKRC